MTTALEMGEGSASRPGRFLPPGKPRHPLYRRLGGPQGRSGQVRKISPPPGFDPRTIQPVTSRYTDYATRPVILEYYRANVGAVVSAAVHSTPVNPFVSNVPEFSTDIANLQLIVACVWHLRLQLGKLAPLISSTQYTTVIRIAGYSWKL
jgi:hypothetical protein